jgi:predicted ATPase
MSAATARLVAEYFVCERLDAHQLLDDANRFLPVYRVLRDSGMQTRLDVVAPRGLTPFVGREQELGWLAARWEQAREGFGQMVILSGEAGIGKSRLVQALCERMGHEGYARIELRCSPYHQNSAWYPVLDHLQRFLQFRHEDTPEAKREKLARVLLTHRFTQQVSLSLLTALLSLPHPESYPPLRLSPVLQKQQTQAALVAWFLEEAERQPALAVWEDVHWADPSTLELLGLLLEQSPTARLLTLLTARPEFRLPWGTRSSLSQLSLPRLMRRQVEEMVLRMTAGKGLPAEVIQQIVARTDGVPLFVEELTKVVLESGLLRADENRYELAAPLPALAIPATLQDSLLARLDRLTTAREVAQLGATMGRQFSYEQLQAVASIDAATLQHELTRLVEAELLYQRGIPPQATYIFKHTLIQEATYQSLLRSTRQQYHERIAQVLETQFPETVVTHPELLAHHFMEAGLRERAVGYWQQAGQRAIERSAGVEAVSYFTKGLEALRALPDGHTRAQSELGMQMSLGPALIATRGYAAADVERTYTRALELCQQLGEPPQSFPVRFGL